ncbi:MAG: GNAT family N-acetyltransferase [Candidatus Brocadiaceae bacterium]
MNVHILQFEPGDDLGELEAAWRSIQGTGGVSHPMYSWEWVSTWWQVFGSGRTLLAGVRGDEEGSAAIVPVVHRSAVMNRLFPYERLELLGTGEATRHEVYSEYVDFPVRPGVGADEVAPAVQRLLHAVEKWGDIVLHRVRRGSVAHEACVRFAEEAGHSVDELRSGPCHYIELPESADDYLYELSKKRRYQLRRTIRRLEDLGEVTCERARSLEDALEVLSDLARLHQERWEALGEAGVFAGDLFPRFHEEFLRRTFELGWPQLWRVKLDGEPIACRYNLRYEGTVYCYLSGMKLLEDTRIQPGILAHYRCIEHAIETGAKEYDFMLGDQHYKESLSNSVRELVSVRICRNTLKEKLRRGVVSAVRGARKLRPSWLGGED